MEGRIEESYPWTAQEREDEGYSELRAGLQELAREPKKRELWMAKLTSQLALMTWQERAPAMGVKTRIQPAESEGRREEGQKALGR